MRRGELSPGLLRRIVERLGLSGAPGVDHEGLRALYAGWCLNVPFDNVRKFIALRTPDAELPGRDAGEFFEQWLEHGAGGTCWATSNALSSLAGALGFSARRVAGSMRDTGVLSHGTVKVRTEGRDWLVDTSMLWGIPVPLGDQATLHSEGAFVVEVEPAADSHLFWSGMRPGTADLPCRLLVDPADDTLYDARHEASRLRSPFNNRLYAHRNRPAEVVILNGHTRTSHTADGQRSHELTGDEVCRALHEDIGISEALIRQWVRCGGLDAAFEGPKCAPMPEIAQKPPSQRECKDALSHCTDSAPPPFPASHLRSAMARSVGLTGLVM